MKMKNCSNFKCCNELFIGYSAYDIGYNGEICDKCFRNKYKFRINESVFDLKNDTYKKKSIYLNEKLEKEAHEYELELEKYKINKK